MSEGGLRQRASAPACGAIFLGVLGHATPAFLAVLSGVAGPELSVWRFLSGGLAILLICGSVALEAFWPRITATAAARAE